MNAPVESAAQAATGSEAARWAEIRRLHRLRPRSRFLGVSLLTLGGLAAYAWSSGTFAPEDLFSPRRRANLERFLTLDVVPFPARGEGFAPGLWWRWAAERFAERGFEAVLITLWIAVLAIALASLGALLLAPFATRTLASRDPYLLGETGASAPGRAARRAGVFAARGLLVLARSLPEYVLAFLLLAVLGPGAWPAILALALHNAGILGRLGAEVAENLEPGPSRALAQAGASRGVLWSLGALPQGLGRLLLYAFYRFETCVREATVLGMLGVVSLGYWIGEARAAMHYDELLFYVALGAGLVLLADLASSWARRLVRRA